jgi:hypothetical protein
MSLLHFSSVSTADRRQNKPRLWTTLLVNIGSPRDHAQTDFDESAARARGEPDCAAIPQ